MNILVLNYEFPPIGGGAAPVSYDMAKLFALRGHKVTVVTMAYQDLQRYEVKDGFEIYRIPCLRAKENVCHPWEQLTYILSGIWFLNKHLKNQSNRYDICHTHFIIPTGVISWWAKKNYGLPYVITSHGSDVEGYNQQRFKSMHKLLRKPWVSIVKSAKVVVSPSKFLHGLLTASYCGREYPVIPNGLFLEQYRRLPKKRSIVTLCRLQKAKGVQHVIKAIATVEMNNWVLNIIGDGPYRESLESLCEQLGVQRHVVFHGWVENKSEKLLNLLGEAAIFVSASNFENCPISVMEAVACGAYPLLSDIPPHHLLVDDSKHFFPCEDPATLADRLQPLLSDANSLDSGIEMEQYDWNRIIDRYLTLMQG